ncbi:MAG: hypothetical protein RL701_6945 [Pseudomonadota bacterium]|jgi:hypothetical protein
MFNSAIFDVAIGIAFVFMLVSTACSALREGIEALLKTRATYLEYGIRELLNDRKGEALASQLFNHPLILGLFHGNYEPGQARTAEPPKLWQRGNNLPSYIPTANFATALMDLVYRAHSPQQRMTFQGLYECAQQLPNTQVRHALLAAMDAANGNLDRVRTNLEAWYDATMDRVSGWYKRSTQAVIFGIALVVVLALNLNTISIAQHLYRDEAVRKATVGAAAAQTQPRTYEEVNKQFEALRFPIGWSAVAVPSSAAEWGQTLKSSDFWNGLLGLLMTTFAATLGAPFWFDVLNRFMVIRATVKPHEKSPEESSEDRQVPARALGANTGIGTPISNVPPARPANAVHAPAAEAHDADGCGASVELLTTDAELPPATGGVA